VYGTVYGYTVRYGNMAYSRIYTVLDRIYGKIRYSVRYGPNFESLSQKINSSVVLLLLCLRDLSLLCTSSAGHSAAAVEDRKPHILILSRCSFMRASCADLTLGQCLAYLTSIAAAAVVAAAGCAAAAGAGAAAASSSSAISWSPPAAAAPAAAGTGRLSNEAGSHTQAFSLTLACF